jgi:hypothetical protein
LPESGAGGKFSGIVFLLLHYGHNRFAICQKHDLPFATTALEFADRQSAFNWIINNQLGRRNLHPDQASYLRGKRYNAEKASVGGDRGNQYTVAKDQNDPLPESTADRLATEYKVSAPTIKRDGNYAAAVDTLQKAGIEPQTVIAHESKSAVVEFAKLITPEPELPPTPLLPPVPPKPKDPLVAAVTEKVKAGEMTVIEAAKEIRQAKTKQRREKRLERIVEISQGNIELKAAMRFYQVTGCPFREYRQEPGNHSPFHFRHNRARLFRFTFNNEFVMYDIHQPGVQAVYVQGRQRR